ncbi:MAG TPA: O-antigen ligase family protein [Solirubrobacteraceae bacterium]
MRPIPPLLTEAAWWALVLAVSAATAWLTLRSPQLGCTAALVILSVGLYVASRPHGLAVMWLVWIVAPLLRRLFGLEVPLTNSDPLALAPFLVVGCIVALELRRVRLSRYAVALLAVATVGYLLGVPAGVSRPPAMAFALFAYVVAIGCFILGYSEPRGRELVALQRVLMVAMPLAAVYGILQYLGPLPRWDELWLNTVGSALTSVGAPEEGHIRVFGTLNSPGTFAAVLGLSAVCFLAQRRFDPFKLVAIGVVLAALLLTYVRSEWAGLVVSMFVLVLASRGRASWRVLLVVGLLVVGFGAVVSHGQTGQAIVGRANTFGSLNSDISAKQRVATPVQLVPEAITQPFGHGIGSAGEASRLGPSSGLRQTDNAYLSLLYQAGPFGFVLVLGAALVAFMRAVGNLARYRSDPLDVLVIAMLSFLFVGMVGGDLLYGVTGMVFWYLVGVAVKRSEAHA